jgi:hypothetical protein
MRVTANVPNNWHQHFFERAAEVMRPGTGDVLYAWVNLDPTYPPTEVMLQWYRLTEAGSYSWEQRAYWGANTLNWGVNNTVSRWPMGGLPASNVWVRLEVPASAVGLEGKLIEGMAFTLYGGRAAWGAAGIIRSDLDGDDLPDAWEIQYFGGLSSSAEDDVDGDGLSNAQEYQLGTDPTLLDTDGDGQIDQVFKILITRPGKGGAL